MIMLEQSWSTLFQYKFYSISTQDTDDPFGQLAEILDELRVLDHELVPDGLTSERLIFKDEEAAISI